MDKNGIGTDATIATHISTIQTREYVIKDQHNRFIPTKLGEHLTSLPKYE
jgi:DNA topoisomerase-3